MMQKVVVDKRQELQRHYCYTDPSVSIVSGDSIICKGGSANFVVNGSGGTNLTYQWQYHNGTSFVNVTNATIGEFTYTGATTNTLQINTTQSVASNMTGYRYQVLVSDSKSGCVTATSAEVKLIVKEDPSVTTQAQDSTICIGGAAKFSVVASGGTTLTYQWQYLNGQCIRWVADRSNYTGNTSNMLQVNTTTVAAGNVNTEYW